MDQSGPSQTRQNEGTMRVFRLEKKDQSSTEFRRGNHV
eukprot:CAMPEP_0184299060 /NCGR_PEP_ID=MMETSP1049-20130417/9746_1 /TAXON_ID=77928 /ORGANISM="Proteomonas sulcata, Strain CCMP704" /LENGTH=37 /DNA_ID= /DNA_START= /DNA_END= /DNA_ORIENTATION=